MQKNRNEPRGLKNGLSAHLNENQRTFLKTGSMRAAFQAIADRKHQQFLEAQQAQNEHNFKSKFYR